MTIGECTIAEIGSQVTGLLEDYQGKVNEAFLKSEAGLTISFSVNIAPAKNGFEVETGISFTAEKIKDKTLKKIISEIQLAMFPAKGG